MHIHKSTIFMHDGSPCNRFKKVRNNLTAAKVTTLELAGNNPNLNPMEIPRRKIADNQPSSACVLIDEIKNVLMKETTVEYYKNLIHNMPQPHSGCHTEKGGMQNSGLCRIF